MTNKEKMSNKQSFARVVCIVGGIFDAMMLPAMLFPELGGRLFGIQHFLPGSDYRYAMNLGASLMLGWTLLLFWAARRPIERAGVLLLTAIVILGLMLSGVSAVFSGLILMRNMLPVFILQFCVMALFLTGYFQVSRIKQAS
jgi:hypothetical protein